MRVAVVPGVRALLPRYASLVDPVADLRAACLAAVEALGPRVRVVAASAGSAEVARSLLAAVGAARVDEGETGVLVVGNGTAKRTEKAPGHFDERAEAYDDRLRAGLLGADPDVLAPGSADAALAADLWAETDAFTALPGLVPDGTAPEVLYDAAPFGVQYWVLRWATHTDAVTAAR